MKKLVLIFLMIFFCLETYSQKEISTRDIDIFFSLDYSSKIDEYLFKKNTFHQKSRIKYALNLDESRTRVREYGRANSAMKNASYKKWAKKNCAKIKDSRLKRTYGISGEDYDKMFEQQNGRCAICETHYQVLCVDHCHKTGKVRKLLCRNCNTGIGQLKDNPNLLVKAASYINEHTFDPDVSC